MSKKPSILEVIKKHLLDNFINTESDNEATKKASAEYEKEIENIKSKLKSYFTDKELFRLFFELDSLKGSLVLENIYNSFISGLDAGFQLSNELKAV